MNKELLWTAYDPQWLISLAQEQCPEEEWLPQALTACTCGMQKSEGYIYFVDPSNPNKPGSLWQFERNIFLDSPTEGSIVLDILKNQRVGGAEFYSKLLKGPGIMCPCGFVHNYTHPSRHGWATIPLAGVRSDIRRPYGTLYQCPECGRLIWRKPGETTYAVFLLESEA